MTIASKTASETSGARHAAGTPRAGNCGASAIGSGSRLMTPACAPRWFALATSSSEIANDHRSQRIDDRPGQPSPQADQRAIARIRRVVLWNRIAHVEVMLVGERAGLESPVLLERIGTAPTLAAAVVENAHAAL